MEAPVVTAISNLLAERQLLGACIDHLPLIDDADFVTESDFEDSLHGIAWAELCDAWKRGDRNVDLSALAHGIWTRGGERVPSQADLMLKMLDWSYSTGSAAGLARTVKETAVARRLATICAGVVAEAKRPGFNAPEALEAARRDLARVDAWADADTPLASEFIGAVLDDLDARGNDDNGKALATGLAGYDHEIGPWRPGQLIVVAARPGQGKSSLAKSIAHNLVKRGDPAWMWSLEMTKQEVSERFLSAEARVDGRYLSSGKLNGHASAVMAAAHRFGKWPLAIEDQIISNEHALSRARRWNARPQVRDRLGLVVVDYLGLIPGKPGKDVRKVDLLGAYCQAWKHFAVEVQKPVLMVAQLNRDSEKQQREPILSDLRDSGEIEQHANIVLFPVAPQQGGKATIIVAKNRNGRVGVVDVDWAPEYTEFSDRTYKPHWSERT